MEIFIREKIRQPLHGNAYVSACTIDSMKFKILLQKDEDGWYVATVPALPGCISQGKTEEEALSNAKEAIELHLKTLAEDGIPIIHSAGAKEAVVSVEI